MSKTDALLREEQEILDQLNLLKREQELKLRLAEIRREKESNGQTQPRVIKKQRPQPSLFASGVGTAKENDTSWEKYTAIVVATLGGKPKASEVITYAEKANPGIPKKTVSNAITNKLSKLYRKKKISAEADGNRKDGYDYFLTDEQKRAFGI